MLPNILNRQATDAKRTAINRILPPLPCLDREYGGNNRARTYDPLLVRQMLSQLSYAPILISDFTALVAATSNIILSLDLNVKTIITDYLYLYALNT